MREHWMAVTMVTQELDQTSSDKIQSAQYGLVLLEEKEGLESRCQVGLLLVILLESWLVMIQVLDLMLVWLVSPLEAS